jgi:hypothetical protein
MDNSTTGKQAVPTTQSTKRQRLLATTKRTAYLLQSDALTPPEGKEPDVLSGPPNPPLSHVSCFGRDTGDRIQPQVEILLPDRRNVCEAGWLFSFARRLVRFGPGSIVRPVDTQHTIRMNKYHVSCIKSDT